MDRLPIPSFHYPALDRILESPDSSIGLDDEDDTESLQTQYEEGAYEDTAWYCTKAKTRPAAASMNTASVRSQTSEPSKRVGRPDLVEASPVHPAVAPTPSDESSSDEDEIPLVNLKRVTRSSTRLARNGPSILTDSGSSDAIPPVSLPDTTTQATAVVAPSPPRRRSNRSNSRESASVVGTDTSTSNRKRNTRSGSTKESSTSKKKTNKNKKRRKGGILRHTTDFEAKTAEAFNIPVHTLILGTHPSTRSLEVDKYYAHPMNAFWWIVGDCLGFRRAKGLTKNGTPYKFTSELRFANSLILAKYEMQLQRLCCNGFGLWNTFKYCSRRGSLNRDIAHGIPNDIRKWCQDRKSIRRIVFSNGKSSFQHFAKHFRDWLESGELVPSPHHPASQQAFAQYYNVNAATPPPDRTIECIVAVAVSPAAATYSYSQKRDFWEEHVFQPGLEDFEEWENSAVADDG